jgi:hypothetical protein
MTQIKANTVIYQFTVKYHHYVWIESSPTPSLGHFSHNGSSLWPSKQLSSFVSQAGSTEKRLGGKKLQAPMRSQKRMLKVKGIIPIFHIIVSAEAPHREDLSSPPVLAISILIPADISKRCLLHYPREEFRRGIKLSQGIEIRSHRDGCGRALCDLDGRSQ